MGVSVGQSSESCGLFLVEGDVMTLFLVAMLFASNSDIEGICGVSVLVSTVGFFTCCTFVSVGFFESLFA